MQGLSIERHGVPWTLKCLRFMSIRMRAHPETASLLGETAPARSRLDNADEACQEVEEEATAAYAVLEYKDSLLDDGVADLSSDVTKWARNNPDSDRQGVLFPIAPSTATRGVATEEQDTFVTGAATTLRPTPRSRPCGTTPTRSRVGRKTSTRPGKSTRSISKPRGTPAPRATSP